MNCSPNIITANFSGGKTSATTAPLWQWDYGQVLCITGIEDLPAAFEVHFSTNKSGGVSTVAVGADGQVTIPNVLLTIGKSLNAWIYLSDAQGEGETEYAITIPVKARPMPETYDAEATGVFDDVVRQVSEYAETAQTAADNAGASASAAAASADSAAASATAAAGSATAAAQSKADAALASRAASTAAQDAKRSADAAAEDAGEAAISAHAAMTYRDAAEAAATEAKDAKADATTAAGRAESAATAAGNAASGAGQAATAAGQYATSAGEAAGRADTAAQTATTKAADATAAAETAVDAKTAAQTAQQGAETAETNAGQSASTATTKAAEAAQSATDAASAKTAAESAATRAEQAAATLTVDTALSDTSTNPVQNKVITGELTNVKNALNEYVLSRYDTVEPSNWFNASAITYGDLKADGTVLESTTRFYTDFIPVSEGDEVQGFRANPISAVYRRRVCAYDANKNVLSAKGIDSSGLSAFTIQSDVAYVRVTFSTDILTLNPIIVRDGVTPTAYTPYFEPYKEIVEDFLTPESAEYLNGLIRNGISSTDISYLHGCAFPKGYALRQTVGLSEMWYYKSAVTPYTPACVSGGIEYVKTLNDRCDFINTTALNSVNGFRWQVHDVFLNLLDIERGANGYGRPRHIIVENLSDCSLLAIGDSTVDHDTMTETMLSHFAEQGHTLTLLGTLGDGSGTNKNEGRAGWKASDYFTDRQYRGVTNPFHNPSTQTFDFSYYMTNQGYSVPDFVLIQLGINDLYNNYLDDGIIESTWGYISQMIQSIRAYNTGIKILLNLPTTPNSDQSAHSNFEVLYRNVIIRYNEYAQAQALTEFGVSAVRPTYCHLILDPDTDIRDNVHPTAEGYAKMGLEVINQINCWQNGV